MKNVHFYIALALFLFTTATMFAEESYNYKNKWDLRLRISDTNDGEFLDKIERNEEKTDWETEPEKVLQSLFPAVKANDKVFFANAFDFNTTKQPRIYEYFNWMRPYAKYWGRLDVMALGRSVSDKNIVFFAVVTEDEPSIPSDHYDEITPGFKKVIYLKKGTDGWKVYLDYNDKQLETLLDEEIFVSRAGFSFPSKKFAWSEAMSKKFDREVKKKNERFEKIDFEFFLSSNSKYYPKEDLERKYKLLKAMRESDPELCACKTLKDEFVCMLKKGMIKVFGKPIVISNIGASLEEGISDSNPFDFIRKHLHAVYTEPDRIVKWPSGLETVSENYYRKNNLKTYQIIYYTTLEFDGEYYCQLSGLLFNPDNILGGKCKEDQFRLKKYPGDKWDFADSPERPSFLNNINQTNACLDHIINRDNTKEERLYGLTGFGFREKLEKYGFSPVFWIHKQEECIPYKPGMELKSITTLKMDDDTFKNTIK